MELLKHRLKVSVPETISFPRIDPVPEGVVHRPFWSVMIPTHNRSEYLEQTLKSVLEQAPGPEQMQIEVVDNYSTEADIEVIAREIGHNRISFYRQPYNVGIAINWNTCIQRANGYWVHILHDDDLVLPGFYNYLGEGIERESSIGAAFCRHAFIDEKGEPTWMSSLERTTAGILYNWLERIAVEELIQASAIVVKRSTYEKLGGFYPELSYALDWDMYKRIAVHYTFWYEPKILACYRQHPLSITSCLIRSGADVAETRKSIEISKLYLSNTIANELISKAKEHYAFYALNTAYQMFAIGDIFAAFAQIKEALKCSYSIRVIKSLIYLFIRVAMHLVRRIVRRTANRVMEICFRRNTGL